MFAYDTEADIKNKTHETLLKFKYLLGNKFSDERKTFWQIT